MGEEIGPLQNGRAIDFVDPIYSVYTEESQFSSNILRFTYSSMKTPQSVYDYDMTSGISVLKKIRPEESIHPDMLGKRVFHWVQSNLNSTSVITMEWSGIWRSDIKVLKNLAEPNNVLSGGSHCLKLSLSAKYFLDFHAISDEPKNRKKPVTERRSS
ncbi:hypothetical protein KSP39_PZI019838 [Platanthera zijinensis]|uniref:Uncharacterized protein n=1 Tax=Platanthera zijinensis TaxID=2320716 RepID=A0AAP0B2F6_9ASPA